MAARFWRGTGDGNWISTNNWSDTSGGATGFSIPVATDDVIFDGNGNNPCTINTSACVCKTLTVSAGFTNTITHSQQLTVSGNITLHSGYTMSGTSSNILAINATCTFTSGGLVIPLQVRINAAITVTLADDLYISGRLNSFFNTAAWNSFRIYLTGTLSNTFPITGTSQIALLTGSTWSSGIFVSNPVYIEGDCTISSAVKSGGSISYVSGTPSVSGTLTIFPSVTMATNGMSWNNVSITTNVGTVTVSNAWTINGSLTIGVTSTISGSNVTVGNGIAVNAATSGTAKIILTGGTWSGSNTTGLANSLGLQGNVTISGNVYYRTGILTYVSGTITVTSSTLNLAASCTLATNGMSWNTITTTTTTAQTYTINSNLAATTLTLGITAAQTFAGTSGFTVGTLTCLATSAQTINFKEAVTYTVTSTFTTYLSRTGSIVLFTSSHATTKAILTLNSGASNNLLASFTRIDASGGRVIRSFNGVITDCVNIQSFYDLKTITG